jgi:hypothetical protein
MRTIALAVLISLFAPYSVRAQSSVEAEIKSAFVLNFARFSEFSALDSEQKSIEVCLFSNERVFEQFAIIEDKEVHGRRISLTLLADDTTAISQCQIIYFSSSSSQRLVPSLLATLLKSHLLTIGDQEDFIDNGGMIRFFLEDGKVRFEISPENVAKSQVQLSSKLLSIAKIRNGAER